MPTINQILRNVRKKKNNKNLSSVLYKYPQKKGICDKLLIMTPRKPNSALRKVAKIILANGKKILAYIPGEKTIIAEKNYALIKGGATKDLPGLKYKIIPGVLDVLGSKRKNKRSKYGVKKFFSN